MSTPVPLLGSVEQYRKAYRFGPESSFVPDLLDAVPQASDADPVRCIDLGAGSGILGLLAGAWLRHRQRQAEVVLVERNPQAAALARTNLDRSGLRGAVWEADVRQLPDDLRADIVLANPPFFPPGHGRASSNDWTREATHAHFGAVDAFVAAAAERLGTRGVLLLLQPADHTADALAALTSVGLTPAHIWLIHARHTGRPYRVWIAASKSPVASTLRNLSALTER